MKTQSAWSRGLLFGGIFGGALSLLPLVGGWIGKAPLGELLLACGVTALIWGGLGFVAGFCSDSQLATDATGHPVPGSPESPVKHWVYRLVAGLLLSYIAVCALIGIGVALYFLWQVDLNKPRTRIPREQATLILIGLCGAVGAEAGAFTGCWLGALLVPFGHTLRSVARRSFVTAALGTLAGGWVGATAGLLHPQFLDYGHAAVLAAIAGGLAGIAAAIVLRLRVLR
jgi:hypothetical protein